MTGVRATATREALAFQRSVIRSGEPYTVQVEQASERALAELDALEAVADAAWASVTEHPGGPDAPSELRNVRCECLRCSALARLVAVQDQTKEDR